MGLLFLEQILNSLQFGLMLFLISSGLTLILGITNIVNLSHGSLVMLGAYISNTIIIFVGSFFWGAVLSLLCFFFLGILIEFTVLRNLYKKDHMDQVLVTFGLILFINEIVKIIWGSGSIYSELPNELSGNVEIFGEIIYSIYRILVILLGCLVAIIIYITITKTRLGILIRASASDPITVNFLGVNVPLLYKLIFSLSATLAGLAGMLLGPIVSIEPGMGEHLLIISFVVIILGGIGSIKGAFLASLFVGVIDTFGRVFLPSIFKYFFLESTANTVSNYVSSMMIYIVMVTILIILPKGFHQLKK